VVTESREALGVDGNFVDDKGQCYRAHEELGRGVLTSVRSACRHVDDHADDASDALVIKTVLPLWIGHPLAEARIARERDVSRALETDNPDDELGCARVLAFGRQTCDAGRSRPFHVSARLRGCTLAEHLRSRGEPGDPAVVRGALAWVDDLLVALARVHAAGWVHRDVKPQNVFLHSIRVDSTAWSEATVSGDAALPRRNGPTQREVGTVDAPGRRRARLLDFGLAVPMGSQRPDFDEPFGTPAYVSPEVIAGARIDARADLYSIGLILFHLVAGRRPFTGDPIALLEAHLSEPPPPLRSLQPRCSPALERAVALALNKAPGERPSSASELRALLSDVPEAHAQL
jgi:serine/threonine protein kinase